MSENQKQQLHKTLWDISNKLRGSMGADEFRDYILGFIFYKYLSEKMLLYANKLLEVDKINFEDINENTSTGKEYLEAIKEESLGKLGYFLKPSQLFKRIATKGNNLDGSDNFILEELKSILNSIEQSTMGVESEDDFDGLFKEIDLTSNKLGNTDELRNKMISKVLITLDKIDFQLENTELDILGDAYEYLISKFASVGPHCARPHDAQPYDTRPLDARS